MASYQLTISLGSGEDGEKRRAAYEKASKKDFEEIRGALNHWCKKYLDKAAGYKPKND